MTIEEYWDNLTANEKGTFQRACRTFLKQTFIVRDKDEDSRKLYFFVSRNEDFMEMYLSYMGFDLIVDRDDGVAMMQNHRAGEDNAVQTNHLRLKKIDSIILCALWTLYADRMQEGKLSRSYQISVADLSFAMEKFHYKGQIDKVTLRNSLSLLSSYNLIHVEGNLGQPDCLIVLYPSLRFAMNKEAFKQFADNAAQRMSLSRNESIDEIEKEDTDDSESDE